MQLISESKLAFDIGDFIDSKGWVLSELDMLEAYLSLEEMVC